MHRANGASDSGGQRSLWAGFVAVFVPLAVLLVLQFVWLSRLERYSAIAHRAALENYLDAIGNAVQDRLVAAAKDALRVPAAAFVDGNLEKAVHAWRKKPPEGARRLFLVDYTRERFGNFLVLDPEGNGLQTPPASDESLAMIMATTPWQLASYQSLEIEEPGLVVDERNPDHRMILLPVVDDASHVVGLAGMVIDREWVRNEALPSAIKKYAPGFFPGLGAKDVVVTVRDGRGSVVLGDAGADAASEAATRRLPFAFSEWTVGVRARRATSEEWARTGFYFNVALAVVLVGVMAAGAVFALRAANRAVHLSELKSDFVSNVSHELRTPVASIRVFAELLRTGKVTDVSKIREYGDYIETESRRLSRLVDNILDFARIESGRKTYRFSPASLEDLVTSTVQTFGVRLRDAGFSIDYTPPESSLPEVVLDADAVALALHNLVDNAVKYSGDARWIGLSVARDGADAVVAVADRGIGVAREEQRRIFDRFHRVGTSLVHDVKGSGLGLSIVRHVVEAHGGRVTVSSEPGKGSVFTIRLPLVGPPAGVGG